MHCYEILATGPNCGFIEVINDALQLDEIHKKTHNGTLEEYFIGKFGKGKKNKAFRKA
jgi:phosphatidylinositol kinase/protein kinase (PI-3  family)